MRPRVAVLAAALVLTALVAASTACSSGGKDSLIVYSGRSEDLVQPLIDQFEEDTGIDVQVKYGETAEMAATILEEGSNSPADVYYGQDAGALGYLAQEGRLAELPQGLLDRIDSRFRARDGRWIGLSGRARVVAYNVENVDPATLPSSILDFTDEEWDGRIGWAPTNGSFQAFVTALRLIEGEDAARAWLEAIKANGAKDYPNNTAALEAAANGEVDVVFVNHYYLYPALAEQGDGFGARNHYTGPGDAGSLVNVAGAGILDSADNRENAERFLEHMLSEDAQQYFADETFEYPLIEGIETHPDLLPLSELEPPDIDLSDISDLNGTLDLLRETGVLP
ncbi:MAG: iron ABC transporter substrate-binding protein [Dehalococcoidia bacterium]